MRTTLDAGSVLFGRARRLVLGWLYSHADEAFYLRQIARQTGLPVGSIQGELEQLVAAGLITRTVQGRQVYFQANAQSPIFRELQSLLTKTGGIAEVIRDGLAPLGAQIRAAFIYGSAARNELRAGSDVDVLVVGEVDFEDVVRALRKGEERLGREINPTVYPPEEFRTKLRDGHHFLNAVLREPYLLVLGTRDELERLGGAEQVAGRTLVDETGNQRHPRRRRSRASRQPRRRAQR
jgi:predicted nucleotidyltransferase